MEDKVSRLVEQFKALINALHEGIIAIDAQGKIAIMNLNCNMQLIAI